MEQLEWGDASTLRNPNTDLRFSIGSLRFSISKVMAGKKVIAICQSGGEFETNNDGSLSYRGGDAHAMEIDEHMKYNDFKMEVAEMFNSNVGNKKTLITISNDKDLERMIKFHGESNSTDIYVLTEEVVAPDVSNMSASRSSRTTLSEAGVLIDAPLSVVDDTTQPAELLDNSFVILDDTTCVDAHMDIPIEVHPLLTSVGSIDENHSKVAQQWQNNITGVGQRFNSVHEFRETLRKYAIANQFAFKYKKNDSHRVTVKCKAEGCPWRIHASSIIKEKLKVHPNYKPKDIVNDIKQEYGIQLNYFQAWRGKEIAKEQLQGSYKEAYNQLPFFCEKMMETNPGSVATFATNNDSSFHRLFVSFHASLYVVDAETDDNWCWFLLQLKSALSVAQSITFVADREKGLRESIADIFRDVDVHHGYCIHYLSEQLLRDVKGQFSHEVKRLMVEDVYAAAYAPRSVGFQSCVESIKSISLEAYNWVIQSKPEHWANAFFQGARYNHMTSNFGELFYSWASDAHELPITQMVDAIRGKVMELIYTRREDSNQWLTRLTPSMEEKLEKESLKSCSLQVSILAGNRFEVGGDSIEVVDLDQCDCSCKGWQLTGLPCCHAIAVISWLGRNPYDYCSRYFMTDSYRLTYSESIHPVPNVERPMQKESSQSLVTVTPPLTRRPPGRPSTKRFGSQEVVRRQLQCSRCKGTGHNKSTCKDKKDGSIADLLCRPHGMPMLLQGLSTRLALVRRKNEASLIG
ncbi:hypothetical protein HYC85_017013 [Camellia sinensis]|uniref:SWIM-type domain-containing protein n=1 Tax=Camellia sinensis TaxID=4442 RepID=A0A7J7H2J8_CAMSI|nr:hypothetical protein HYC85_017013 [Camellia sinensis]